MVKHKIKVKEFEFDQIRVSQTCAICEANHAKWMVLKLGTKWALFLCDDCIKKMKTGSAGAEGKVKGAGR